MFNIVVMRPKVTFKMDRPIFNQEKREQTHANRTSKGRALGVYLGDELALVVLREHEET